MMKKQLLLIALLFVVLEAHSQSRKHISNFSQYQQYYNPALTGFGGSVVKTLYRNQWTGFEDAPKTIFLSGEADLADFGKQHQRRQLDQHEYSGAGHAVGVAIVQDRFGPLNETQVFMSYGSRIRLSDALSLRWGTALTYSANRIDGTRLTVDQEEDPRFQDVLGQKSRIGKLDLNLGLALVTSNFYLGYALQDITEGDYVTLGDDFLQSFYLRKHMAQVGYRALLSEQVGVVVNGIFQYDDMLQETVEGQLKLIYQNMLWAGGGYRKSQAYNITAGVLLERLSIGYAYENPVQDARSINKGTNEVFISYRLAQPKTSRANHGNLSIW